jgi:ADP-heptose:LPS heptosyltransferase
MSAILFGQHSAAGDVFMTTKALPGIKERHPGLPLVYMTQTAPDRLR